MEIKSYVVVSGTGRLYGPFPSADAAASFIAKHHNDLNGHSRIECVWDAAWFDEN